MATIVCAFNLKAMEGVYYGSTMKTVSFGGLYRVDQARNALKYEEITAREVVTQISENSYDIVEITLTDNMKEL